MRTLTTADGVELHYEIAGAQTGPAVVMTHGVSMDHRMWEPQVSALTDRYRVLTYDMRGHGLSACEPDLFTPAAAAADLVALLGAARIDSTAFVGHSFGGTVSQLVALEHPGLVRAFVGLGCACMTIAPTLTMRAFGKVGGPMARMMGPARMRLDTAKRAGTQPSTRAYALEAATMMDDAMFERAVSVGFGDYVDRPGYHIGVPLLLMQGDKDGYRPLLSSAIAWAKRDAGEYVLVPGAAHNSGQDEPAFVNERLLAFLESVTAEQG